LHSPSQLHDPSATLALSLQTHPAEEESVFLSLAGQLAQVHFPGGHVQVSPHEQADASFLLGQLAQVHWPGGQVQVSPHLYHQPMLRSEKIRKEVDLRASGFTLVGLVWAVGTSTLARLAGTYFSTAIISSHHIYITERSTHLQADLPLSALALLGQFSQVHLPGGQEQVSPHEQADLSFFLSLAGQFSHVHWPGGQVHSVPHLPVSSCYLLRWTSHGHGFDLRASSLLLLGVLGGTSLTRALARWAGARVSASNDQLTEANGERGWGHTCRKKKLWWSNTIQSRWRD
jgi:hypothetical protein